MMSTRKTFAILAFSTALTIVSAAAYAQDASTVANRFKSMLEQQGINLTWTAVQGDASSMVMDGAKVTMNGAPEPAQVGKLTFTGIKGSNGGYAIDSISSEPFSKTQDGVTVNLSPIVFNGVTVPPEGSTDMMGSLMFYRTVKLADFTVKKGDKTAFQMTDLQGEVTPPTASSKMEFKASSTKFTGDLTLVDDPKSRQVIDALGYQQVSGSLAINGSWDPKDGRMEMSQYDVKVDNAGTFGMTFDIGGYTPEFIKSLQALQKKMAEQPAGADNSAQGMAMMGLMQQLTFQGASVHWTDDSLTNKVIEYYAKQQNLQASDIRNQVKAIVPFLTGSLNNPDLAKQISSAVDTYMDSPKNLVIAAKPSTPVPFAQLAAGGMSNPIELTKTLGVTISANQ